MSSQQSDGTDFAAQHERRLPWLSPWRGVLIAAGSALRDGRLVVETPAGERLHFAGTAPGPQAKLVLRRWRALRRMLFGGDVGFAEAYMDGDWSSPDLAALMTLAGLNEAHIAQARGTFASRLFNWMMHRLRRNTRHGSRRNIAAHYDLGNEFYAAWLDAGMTYSSGLFLREDMTLEEAQAAKNERVAGMLALRGGERVLEIGCGWGALAEALIRRHGCHVTGLTLSQCQFDYARQRLADAGFADRSDIRLQDYRDGDGQFDRIASIEMLEAVGEEHWPLYFAQLRERLRPGGIAVAQVITIDEALFAKYRRTPDFIQRYVFPGGMLPCDAALRREIEAAGLVLTGRETFGASYERTLTEWQQRFQAAWPKLAEQGFAPRFKRMWEYYLAYCTAGFRNGAIDVALYRIVKPSR